MSILKDPIPGVRPKESEDGAEGSVRIPWAILADRRLNLNDLRVLLVLYAYADASGVSRPTRATLATMTGLPASRISSVTSRLVTMGWLEKRSGSGKSTTRYWLQPPTDSSGLPKAPFLPTTAREASASRAVSAVTSVPDVDPDSLPSAQTSMEPDLQRTIQKIVHEELTRLNGAGHLAGGDIAPAVKLRLKRFRKGDGGKETTCSKVDAV
ncbi:MAG: helix-turn-helix domain-containing protein [Magnetococcales bacterium]|nr:helix-turn-helix domain-containing protein [Magnetococcales bacterium]